MVAVAAPAPSGHTVAERVASNANVGSKRRREYQRGKRHMMNLQSVRRGHNIIDPRARGHQDSDRTGSGGFENQSLPSRERSAIHDVDSPMPDREWSFYFRAGCGAVRGSIGNGSVATPICDGSPASVHAKYAASSVTATCGKPLARSGDVLATTNDGSSSSVGSSRRARTSASPFSFAPTHTTSAPPSGSIATSARPTAPPSSMRTGRENVRPPSADIEASTRALSLPIVNHVAATRSPAAASEGPFTGQPAILQPECDSAYGADQPFASRRTSEMSRISSSVRSR